jgi:hypothetical protein
LVCAVVSRLSVSDSTIATRSRASPTVSVKLSSYYCSVRSATWLAADGHRSGAGRLSDGPALRANHHRPHD